MSKYMNDILTEREKTDFEKNALNIYNHFGEQPQLEKLIEEAHELAEAVQEKDKQHITEELADCFLMLNQIQLAHEIHSLDVGRIILEKTDRTLQRIKSEYYK